jgi:hypothetical protein
MNVEIGAQATLFPEKEYINGIFVAVFISSKGNSLLGEIRVKKKSAIIVQRSQNKIQ